MQTNNIKCLPWNMSFLFSGVSPLQGKLKVSVYTKKDEIITIENNLHKYLSVLREWKLERKKGGNNRVLKCHDNAITSCEIITSSPAFTAVACHVKTILSWKFQGKFSPKTPMIKVTHIFTQQLLPFNTEPLAKVVANCLQI